MLKIEVETEMEELNNQLLIFIHVITYLLFYKMVTYAKYIQPDMTVNDYYNII